MALVTVVIVATVGGAMVVPAAAVPRSPETSSGYIVVLRDGSDAPAAAQRHHNAEGATVTAVYHAALDGFAATMSAGDAAAVRADPQVESVTPDRTFRRWLRRRTSRLASLVLSPSMSPPARHLPGGFDGSVAT